MNAAGTVVGMYAIDRVGRRKLLLGMEYVLLLEA